MFKFPMKEMPAICYHAVSGLEVDVSAAADAVRHNPALQCAAVTRLSRGLPQISECEAVHGEERCSIASDDVLLSFSPGGAFSLSAVLGGDPAAALLGCRKGQPVSHQSVRVHHSSPLYFVPYQESHQLQHIRGHRGALYTPHYPPPSCSIAGLLATSAFASERDKSQTDNRPSSPAQDTTTPKAAPSVAACPPLSIHATFDPPC